MQRFPSTLFQRVVLSLLVGLWSVLSAAQGCPELKAEDFTVDYYAANADCHTDGQIIVTYRNNVTGFSKLTYETSTNGTSWGSSVEQTSLSVPTTIPLTGWTAGQTIHLRVTATCASGTSTVTFPTQVHRSEMPHAVKPSIETTPAGGCSATAGSIGVSVGSVTGFTKAEYRLYQGTTLLNTITSNTPYAQSNFYNLPSGTYKVVMRATPACTPASPTAAFKNGAYEVEETVKVGYFSILPSPIPTRGTCNGGVRVAVARVMGVNSIKYEILPAGGHAAHAAALQTKQLTFPNFTHTFLGVALGNYEIRATTDCGTVEVVPFSVTTGAPGTLTTKVVRNTYVGCDKGVIMGSVPGTTEACPVDYTLIPKSNPSAPPIVKNGVTTESVTFDNLATGYYEMQASWGGQVQKDTKLIHVVSLGDLELSATHADYACDPSGSVTVKLKNGVYDESMTLTLSLDGTPVRSVTLAATDREKTITNLVPGGYDISLKSECGNEIKSKITVLFKTMPPLSIRIAPWRPMSYDECEGTYSVNVSDNSNVNDVAYKKFIQGATYSLYRNGTLISSGALPARNASQTRPIPIQESEVYGTFQLKIMPACGTPVYEYNVEHKLESFGSLKLKQGTVLVMKPSTACDAVGEISFSANTSGTVAHTLTIRNTDSGATIFTKVYPANTWNINETVSKLTAGNYVYELEPDCGSKHKEIGAFTVGSVPTSNSYNRVQVIPACNGGGGSITYNFGQGGIYQGYTYTYRLADSSGVTVATKTQNKDQVTFGNLAPDTYTLYVALTTPSCTSPESAVEPVVVPSGVPPISNVYVQTVGSGSSAFCQSNGQIELMIQRSPAGLNLQGPFVWHVLDPATGLDIVPTKTTSAVDEHVTFTGLRAGKLQVVVETPCGKIRDQGWLVINASTQPPANLVTTVVEQIFPGCKKGKIKVISDPAGAGLPTLPIRIDLVKQEAEAMPTNVDSIFSSSNITEHTFDNVPEGNYLVRYTYCGMQIEQNVQVQQVTSVTLQASTPTPGPCELGTVEISPYPMDGSLTLEYSVKSKQSGLEVKSGTANGGSRFPITGLEPGKYEISAKIKGSCVETSSKVDATVAQATISANVNYSSTLDCFNNGWVEFRMYSPGTRISKVRYIVQPSGGGTPQVGESTDPTEVKRFINLPAGKYKVQVIAECQYAGGGTVQQYVWNNNGYEIEMRAGYTTMQAYQNDTYMRATMTCPARGSIGLAIKNGNRNNRRVFIQAYNGIPVSPEREIKVSVGYANNEDGAGWGGDLAPGNYRIRINDGCMDILRDIIVPTVGDLVKLKRVECVSTDASCTKQRIAVFIDLSAYPNNNLRCDLANSYEIAVVPVGGDRTTASWSSKWSSTSSVYGQTCDVAWTVDSFPTITGNNAEVLLRLKGCPSTVRRYPVTLTPCCQFGITYQNLDCDRNQFVVNTVPAITSIYDPYNYNYTINPCQQYDVVITNNGGGVVRSKTMTFSSSQIPYTDTDFIVPTDQRYYLNITPHGVTAPTCSGYTTSISKDVRLYYSIQHKGTDCGSEQLTWSASAGCPIKARFVIWDTTNGQIVDQSPGVVTSYASTFRYVRNRKYHIRLYDAGGNLLPFYTPSSGWTKVNVYEHTVTYDTPIGYFIRDFTLRNDNCNGDNATAWGLPTLDEKDPMDYNSIAPQYSHADWTRWRMPPVSRIEIRNNGNGDLYFTDDVLWGFQLRDFGHYIGHNGVGGKPGSWKVRHSNGVVEAATSAPTGNFTLTVFDVCGTKTSNFKVNYLAPPVINISYTASMDCQGKFTIKPVGTAHYPDRSEPITLTFERDSDDDPTRTVYNWGQSYDSFNPQQYLSVYLKPRDGSGCTYRLRFDLSRYYLGFDNSSSASYFCVGSGTGDISIGLKGGNPPYTYKLLKPDGTLVEQKVSSGGVNFKTGQLGEIYRVDATDACGLTHIYQDVLLQDPKQIGYSMNRDFYFCDGEPSSFEAIDLAGATYEWKGPNGFTSTNRKVNITATTATAGTYNLKVHPATCTTTIDAVVKVNVVKVKEVGTTVEKRLCSGQTANINIGPATALSNGVPATNHKYQWQLSEDPTDPNSWSGIVGATSEQLNYTPPFQGTYYVRRLTVLGNCSDYSAVSKIVADPGLNSIVSNDELNVTIDHKNPFTLTAGFVTGNPNRTYQWQRSLDKTTWTNITPNGTNQTYTETQRYGSIVYYKRITSAGTCSTESPIITVRFKKRYPAMVNPHLRQRVLTE